MFDGNNYSNSESKTLLPLKCGDETARLEYPPKVIGAEQKPWLLLLSRVSSAMFY